MTVVDRIAQEVSEFESEHGRKPAEMWLTRRDKSDTGKLGRSGFPLAAKVMQQGVEKAVPALFGVPITSWNATEREDRFSGTVGGMTAAPSPIITAAMMTFRASSLALLTASSLRKSMKSPASNCSCTMGFSTGASIAVVI